MSIRISGADLVVHFKGQRIDKGGTIFAAAHGTPPPAPVYFDREATSGWRTKPVFTPLHISRADMAEMNRRTLKAYSEALGLDPPVTPRELFGFDVRPAAPAGTVAGDPLHGRDRPEDTDG